MSDPISPKYVDVQDETPDPSVRLEATREGVAVVLLNRPKSRNALNGEAVAALTEAFETLQGAEGVRLVILRSIGGTFCAGADLDWMQHVATLPQEDNRLDALDVAHMLKALYDIPALTLAVVEGAAVGIGAGLVAACDSAVALNAAQFSFPETRLGVSPAVLSPYLIEAVGPRAARRLLALGAVISAAEAQRLGLVDTVVEDGSALTQFVDALADDILACAPGAMGEAKRVVREQAGRPIDHRLLEESARRQAQIAVSPEAQEGMAAFLERRTPSWAG
jgi:methylglutaconyl-CoA hydratase